MKYLLLMLLSLSAQATLKTDKETVLPFSYNGDSLKEVLKDYAEMMNLNITYVAYTIPEKARVYLEINNSMSREDYKKVIYNVMDNYGVTATEDGAVIWINSSRDIRYLPSALYTDSSYPKDSRYSTVIHKLKYPLSSEIARNLRPFMSRYGRVIDFSDARTILLHDKGDNISRLIETIQFMDTDKAYQAVLSFEPKIDPDAANPLKEKVIELELDKKILEKKLMGTREGNGGL